MRSQYVAVGLHHAGGMGRLTLPDESEFGDYRGKTLMALLTYDGEGKPTVKDLGTRRLLEGHGAEKTAKYIAETLRAMAGT